MSTATARDAFEAGREDARLEAEVKRYGKLLADSYKNGGSGGRGSSTEFFSTQLAEAREKLASHRRKWGIPTSG